MLVSRRRRYFGGPYTFTDSVSSNDAKNGVGSVDIRSIEPLTGAHLRTTLDAAAQAIPELQDGGSQTNWYRLRGFWHLMARLVKSLS
jgi:hypothetical protein